MTRIRNTLLITAILIFSAGAVAWHARDASASMGRVVEATAVPEPVRPGPTPNSGEPDTGSTKTATSGGKTAMNPTPQAEQGAPIDAIIWMSRVWMARYLGTSL